MPYEDKNELPATPPPLPASHPTQARREIESAKLVGIFYLEFLVAQLVIFTVGSFLPVPEPLVVGVAVVAYLFCLRRLAQKVKAARKTRGVPRWSATIAFWVSMVLPPLAVGVLVKSPWKVRGPEVRQREAQDALAMVFAAEREFFHDNGRYTLNARELPDPSAGRIPRYVVGFATACTVKAGVAQEKAQILVEDPSLVQPHRLAIDAYFRNARAPEDCKDPKDGFELFAVGSIAENAPLDIWKVDEKKNPTNVQRGF